MNHRPGPSFALTALVLCFANFSAVTTEFIVPGILAPMARDLGESIETTSQLVSWFALAAACAGPFIAIVAARLPSKGVLVAAMLLFAVSNLVMASTSDHLLMLIARIVQGSILPALVSISSTGLAALAGAQHTGKAVAILYIGVSAATVLGVPAGVFIADSAHWRIAFAGLAACCLGAALLIGAAVPLAGTRHLESTPTGWKLLSCTTFLLHLLLSATLFTALFCGYTYLPAYLEQTVGLSGSRVGALLLVFGAAGLAGNWLAGRFADRRPFEAAAVAACVLGLAMTGMLALARYVPLLVVLILLWGIAHSSVFVLNQVRVMHAGRKAAGFAASLNISACNLGIGLGATLGAWALSNYGAKAPALMGACLAGIAAILSTSMKLFARSDG